MCILFIALNQHKDYPLIIAANRDEFHARPTAASEFWSSDNNLLAGRDLQANGSWMGVTRNGKIAALTNIRDPESMRTDVCSRGSLVTDWLMDKSINQSHYLTQLKATRHHFNGYNLVFGHLTQLQVYNNFTNTSTLLDNGIYGLSNANIHTPWPKVNKGVESLKSYISGHNKIDEQQLFAILRDETKAHDDLLPQTGIDYEWEKQLSSIFIRTPEYGTRTSTLLLLNRDNEIMWYERTFNPSGQVEGTKQYRFNVR